MSDVRQALTTLLTAAEDGRLEALCARMGLDLVSVFGSSVDPDKDEPADLDVAVRFEDYDAGDVLETISALASLVECDDIDVLVLNQANVVARSRALGPKAKGLFEKRRGQYALAQMAALTEEMETAPMRQLDLELLANR